jgi:hypothetical protein
MKIFSAILDMNMDDTLVNEKIIRKFIIIFSSNDLLLIFLNRKYSVILTKARIIKLIDIILLTPK